MLLMVIIILLEVWLGLIFGIAECPYICGHLYHFSQNLIFNSCYGIFELLF